MCHPNNFWHMNMFLTFSLITLLNPCCYLTIQILVLPLNPLDTLLKLFQSISSQSPNSPNSPFFPIVWHTSNEKPRKGSFLFSTPAHIMYLTTSCVLMCILAPQLYLAFKHKKLCTLVTAMALQRLPAIEAMSAFEIPNTKEAKLICQDPWVSIAVTIITILGVAVYLYNACSKMTFFKGYLYDNVCTVYLFTLMKSRIEAIQKLPPLLL